MGYELNLKKLKKKEIYPLGEHFEGTSKSGDEISFTNYYMEKNGKPFFGVSGEFHYSRMEDSRWEDELIKMKLGGINVVSTYMFWIHHEEEEGVFDFSGRRDIRKFVKLCEKHGLYVILRVGPFDHGEVRNGGLPDWLYGKPFEVRKLNDGFLKLTKILYSKIAEQVSDLFFKDDGPIIGVQIDNEYMHSSAGWEMTTGISDEWIFGGDDHEEYMLTLQQMAADCGLLPVFYTCTGWGGAITPDTMMPLWGGYAFRPWIFYSHTGEHPATDEYVYQDFHNNQATSAYDFHPVYKPEERPYACCEMGGGMMCCYYYRFRYPYKSVDAMANIKIASGCNFLGYYMFQGGSNPIGKHGTYMNEAQVPKISYDYQAALGEFGQVRESYRRLKNIHYFTDSFGETLCTLATVMPKGASEIDPEDMQTLRYSVRTDGRQGYLFVNNYQDHRQMPDRKAEEITLHLDDEDLTFRFGIAGDENAILPFHFDMDGIDLKQATAQVVTKLEAKIIPEGKKTYVFFAPEGMDAAFTFETGVKINGQNLCTYTCSLDTGRDLFTVEKDGTSIDVLVVDRNLANQMYRISGDRLVFTDAALLEAADGIRLETDQAENLLYTYPADALSGSERLVKAAAKHAGAILGCYQVSAEEKKVEATVQKVAQGRYTVILPKDGMTGMKKAMLEVDYRGDIGHAFIDGVMISDNFSNNAVWEIDLKGYEAQLADTGVTIYITPIKEGANVNVESAMAARKEEVKAYIAELKNVRVKPVYEITI